MRWDFEAIQNVVVDYFLAFLAICLLVSGSVVVGPIVCWSPVRFVGATGGSNWRYDFIDGTLPRFQLLRDPVSEGEAFYFIHQCRKV